MRQQSTFSRITVLLSKPSFWVIPILLFLITLPHYYEILEHPGFLSPLMDFLNLDRHAIERILFLIPIVWGGFSFGWRGAFLTSLVSLFCMLPRAVFLSLSPKDALFETGAVFFIGNILSICFISLRREREYYLKMEAADRELKISEERYRQLFENAHDAIWLHNLDGDFIGANRAAEELSGYKIEELGNMNVRTFLSDDSRSLAGQVRQKLLDNEDFEQPYEQRIIQKDGHIAIVQLTTSLVLHDGKPIAFQHIARDITEQKKLQENQRFYLEQATRAQEEERTRISRELHDDTIQALIVLSRHLDAILSVKKGLSTANRTRLEELWQEANNLIQGVRRLSQDLRPAALDRLGLLSALEWLASDVSEFSGIETMVQVHGDTRRLPEEVELLLFRITQEALRNVWRHSEATRADIIAEFEGSRVRITVKDNGKGFNIPGTMGDLAKEGKLGLAGMQERARLVGANLSVRSKPGEGSSVTVELTPNNQVGIKAV